jgi:hypothetical protein
VKEKQAAQARAAQVRAQGRAAEPSGAH